MRRTSSNIACRALPVLFLCGCLLAYGASVKSQDKSLSKTGSDAGSPVVVLSFKSSKSRRVIENADTAGNTVPAAAMIDENKIIARNARAQIPAGARDPNEESVDGRSAAIEKNVQESRSPKSKTVDGYAYRVKVRNTSSKVIEVLFFEYQFTDASNPATLARRQFLCGVKIKPDQEKELQAFSVLGPSDVVSVGSLSNKSGNQFQEKAVINRVEYADDSIWQRPDWKFSEVKESVARATKTPWGAEMCRAL